LTGGVTVNISEGNITSFAAKILEVLPASVLGDAQNDKSDPRRSASTHGGAISIFVGVTTRTRLLGKFHNNVLAHKIFAIEMI